MRAEAGVRPVRDARAASFRRRLARTVRPRIVLAAALASTAFVLATGLGFAGAPDRIAAGVTIVGVDVGGMTAPEAGRLLADRAAALADAPLAFTEGGRRWEIEPADLRARVDWAGAARDAREAGDWPLPVRGLRRLALRAFGAEVEPRVEIDEARLESELAPIARAVDRRGRSAAIVLDGLSPKLVPERNGRVLDRGRAGVAVAGALARLERRPVPLPVAVERPRVGAHDLAPVLDQVRTVLSAPVRFGWRDAHWLVEPSELAKLLALPAHGTRELRIAGAGAGRYFERLARAVDREPRDAGFAVQADGSVRVVPAKRGRTLDVMGSADRLLAAALSTDAREAELAVAGRAPELTTAAARKLGVTTVLATYTTLYSGAPDRIRNLQLATGLLDGVRIAPGETFSFNRVVGPRTEQRGFRPAPVIIGGEYAEGIGGGVSQVATTVFNVAWEAGLKIAERNPHALYISRYPLGRDATVNYPDLDLRFVNDTARWLVLRATSEATGISISLLGAPTRRRVESEAGPLRITGPPRIEKIPDPTLLVGERVVEDAGVPPTAVSVKRVVYEGERVLYDETWTTSYRSEPRIVRVGTKPRPAPDPRPKQPKGKPKPGAGGESAPPAGSDTNAPG